MVRRERERERELRDSREYQEKLVAITGSTSRTNTRRSQTDRQEEEVKGPTGSSSRAKFQLVQK
jgi:hypothetical protein